MRGKTVTAGELMKQLEADPAFVARREAREREMKARQVVRRAEEEPILLELRTVEPFSKV